MTARIKFLALVMMGFSHYSQSYAVNYKDSGEKNIIGRIAKVARMDSVTSEENANREAHKFLQLCQLCADNGQFFEAIEYLEKADSLYMSVNDIEYHGYTLTHLYDTYYKLGDISQYSMLKNRILQLIGVHEFSNPEISMIIHNQVGRFYEDDGNYELALKHYKENLSAMLSFYGNRAMQLMPNYYSLASLSLKTGDFKNAGYYICCLKSLFEEETSFVDDYVSMILLECEYLNKLGKIGDAIANLESNFIKYSSKITNPELKSIIYATLGSLYMEIGDAEKALYYAEKEVAYCRESRGINSTHYAHSLMNLAEDYAVVNNQDKALELTLEAVAIIQRLYGENHPEYYIALDKLTSRYLYLDMDRSQQLRLKCLALSKELYGENSVEYADNLVYCTEISLHPSRSDIEAYRKAIEIRKSIGKDNDSYYLSHLHLFCVLLYLSHQWSELLDASNDLLNSIRLYIALNFNSLSEAQRENLWNVVKNDLDGIESYAAHYSQYAVEHNDYSLVDSFSQVAYDARLIKKGFLLCSNQNLQRLIDSSPNPTVSTLQNQISILKTQLENRHSDKENIILAINNLERQLIDIVSPNGEFIDFLSFNWKDVQASLQSGEVAIEFFSYPVQDDIQYGAIILTNSSFPLAINLFIEKELEKYIRGGETIYDYSNPGLYKTIWSVLETFSSVREAHTIYFSADNIINTISIESLCDETGVLASEKHKIYRLSSTREIISHRKSDKGNFFAVLYGGLNYDASEQDLEKANQDFKYTPNHPISAKVNTRAIRGRADFLKWTLPEIENISLTFPRNMVQIYAGAKGTEESFVNIAMQKPSIIHLATHGFFYEPEDIEDKLSSNPSNYSFLRIDNIKNVSTETLAMRGSGLLFSGANLTLTGKNRPENISDGILSAEELSFMNLSSVNLAVLSACETGLGASTEEGVFGLQRGFKLAGVHSLLMSLWKVNDKVTSQLMQDFYINLSQGFNLVDALKNAQEKIRSNYRTSAPYYWAGWILLDGLN